MFRIFPRASFGIDVENDFEPKYITIRGKGEFLPSSQGRQKGRPDLPGN